MSFGKFLTTIILIWLICLWLAPKFIDRTQDLLSKKILPIIGCGLLGLICIPLICILLFIVGITSQFALILLALYFILLTISSAIFIISITNIISKKIKAEKTIAKLGILILCSIVFKAISLIPFIGGIISFIALLIGLGTIIYNKIKFK